MSVGLIQMQRDMFYHIFHASNPAVDARRVLRHGLWVLVPHPSEVIEPMTTIAVVTQHFMLTVVIGEATCRSDYFINYRLYHDAPFLPTSICVLIKPLEFHLEAVYLISSMYLF